VKGLLKWPLIIAAIVVVGRVVAERAGAPNWLSNSLSVAVLHMLIVPIYFGIRLGALEVRRPYLSLFANLAIYVVLVRLMVIPTYWLAYIYQWPEARFSATQGAGVVGEGVAPVSAYLVIPFGTALSWVVGTVVVGGILGSICLAIRRSASRSSQVQVGVK
jgi:hypothetical protein